MWRDRGPGLAVEEVETTECRKPTSRTQAQNVPLGASWGRCAGRGRRGILVAAIIPPNQIYLFVFRARGIADRLHALDIGIRDIRQILNPLRDVRHALSRDLPRPPRPDSMPSRPTGSQPGISHSRSGHGPIHVWVKVEPRTLGRFSLPAVATARPSQRQGEGRQGAGD